MSCGSSGWWKKGRIMDKLSRDAAAAWAAGLSYGKWKALQEEKARDLEHRAQEIAYGQEKRKNCIVCGRPIPAKARRRLYCGEQCVARARAGQKKIWRDAHREKWTHCEDDAEDQIEEEAQ